MNFALFRLDVFAVDGASQSPMRLAVQVRGFEDELSARAPGLESDPDDARTDTSCYRTCSVRNAQDLVAEQQLYAPVRPLHEPGAGSHPRSPRLGVDDFAPSDHVLIVRAHATGAIHVDDHVVLELVRVRVERSALDTSDVRHLDELGGDARRERGQQRRDDVKRRAWWDGFFFFFFCFFFGVFR